ncbi:Hypothetical protein R9X50_00344300 [Acrodontium crateriforme]|uniref:Uncharacterized protein n=1 Tax=Acrodontium crateriforme TaxID=150365 RepID=A0AAQ3RBV0_9PEZI|nr:Hypothetical protein R9X50_00344300 [Acrodontium crateriforme]
MKPTHSYDQIPEKEEDEGLLPAQYAPRAAPEWWRRPTGVFLTGANIVLFLITASLALWQSRWFQRGYSSTMNEDIKKVSWYSPVLDRVEIPLVEKTYDNTLYAHSKLAQLPSPETDKAWNEMTRIRLLLVNDDEVRRLGKDPEYTVKHPNRTDANVAVMAVDHQLHCLESIRRNTFNEYYFPHGSSSVLHMDHLLHCFDLLAQTLQCNSAMDVITYNWWELATDPVPDFRINMKCRDFNAYRDFTTKPLEESGFFQVWEEGWGTWHRTGGEKNVTAPKQWWQLQLDDGAITKEQFEAKWGPM